MTPPPGPNSSNTCNNLNKLDISKPNSHEYHQGLGNIGKVRIKFKKAHITSSNVISNIRAPALIHQNRSPLATNESC
jgi:hypothetical protein